MDDKDSFLSDARTVEFIVEDSDDAESIRTGELTDLSIGFDDSLDRDPEQVNVAYQQEYTGGVSFDIDAETVVCPGCDSVNAVLPSPWLSMFTDEPVPCVSCGYPLL